jgi:ABC-type glycerol-3-phosphate transport system substrate-binding protein
MKAPIALAACLALAACGGGGSNQSASENAAEQLEDAAEMSNPAAAPVLENGAEAIREQGGNAADAQNVLQEAGNAQAK